ncbi:sigma factor-like helix-turn-helix DNA-binding protein [Paraglaciecola sp. MB-3u-78]|jgi:DNA-directed RNA polymerase specialized sigma24 family protein|nr:sigma factor-like helix-turn-helix DNA-binding protein [Paraglaciecola sp. MB-3u-78]
MKRNSEHMLEISDLLGIPTGTVKSRLHQARKLIQTNLQAD